MLKAENGDIAISLYAYLWGKFESLSKPLTMEQQTDLDGLLSDIARELAAKFIALPNRQHICHHCGLDLAKLPAEANIWPHMTGYCKEAQPAPTAR